MAARMIKSIPLDELGDRVERALADRYEAARISDLEQLLGGTSSLTYKAAVNGVPGSARVVVKVAPPGLEPTRNRDVLRQARLFDQVQDIDGLAVPAVLAQDAGAPPEVPPLFVMTFAEGDSFEPLQAPPGEAGPVGDDQIRSRGLAAARMLAALHSVDVAKLDLGPETVVTPEGELDRWARVLATADDDLRPAKAQECEQRLREHIPAPMDVAIVHGDFRLGNLLSEGPSIRAVIDWEIWSLGDPRIDLAWMLAMSDPSRPGALRTESALPTVAELRAGYEAAAGAELADFGWFEALVRFKMATTSAMVAKNGRRQEKPNPRTEEIGSHIPALVDWALSAVQ